jgi:hypothetical protein
LPKDGCTRPELQYGKKFFNRDRCVAENAAKCAEGNFRVKGNRDGEAPRVGGMAKADVATLLAYSYIAKLSQARIRSAPEMTGSFGLIG